MALMRGRCSKKACTLCLPSSATAKGAVRSSPPPDPLKYLVDLNRRLSRELRSSGDMKGAYHQWVEGTDIE